MNKVLEVRKKFPLWYLLSPQARGKLAAYQWEHFGVQLVIPPFPYAEIEVYTKRGFWALDRLMRETPNYPISVQGRK